MTREWLDERVAYWRGVLRLRDWDIVVEFPSKDEFEAVASSVATAWTHFDPQYRKAVIWLRHPDTNPPTSDDVTDGPMMKRFPFDVEQTLLHELLHLIVLRGMGKRDMEFAVETLANSFLRLEQAHQARAARAS